jgi:hypothetical protein
MYIPEVSTLNRWKWNAPAIHVWSVWLKKRGKGL